MVCWLVTDGMQVKTFPPEFHTCTRIKWCFCWNISSASAREKLQAVGCQNLDVGLFFAHLRAHNQLLSVTYSIITAFVFVIIRCIIKRGKSLDDRQWHKTKNVLFTEMVYHILSLRTEAINFVSVLCINSLLLTFYSCPCPPCFSPPPPPVVGGDSQSCDSSDYWVDCGQQDRGDQLSQDKERHLLGFRWDDSLKGKISDSNYSFFVMADDKQYVLSHLALHVFAAHSGGNAWLAAGSQ